MPKNLREESLSDEPSPAHKKARRQDASVSSRPTSPQAASSTAAAGQGADESAGQQPDRSCPQGMEVLPTARDSHASVNEETFSEVGIIERIELKNFMNHSHLDFNFHKRVNFVTGRNGTGKSALLTGIVVGLGGKASSTNRGSSLRGFVKDGKQVAEITIHLCNKGSDAFEPAKYGDKVVVHRKLTAGGASEYQLRSHANKLISKRREDLDTILDHFNIQVDNPIAVLTQEVSKNFLWSKSPADKYRFFLKATQLDQMKDDHQLAVNEKNRTADILKSKEEMLPRLEQEVNEWEAKHKALVYKASNLQELREQLHRKKQELAWATVELSESLLADKEQNLCKKKTGRMKFDQKVTEAKENLDDALKKKKDIEDQIKKMKSSADAYVQEHERAKRKKDETIKVLREVQTKLRESERHRREVEQDRDDLRKRIHEIQNSSQDYISTKRHREEKMSQLQEGIQQLKSERQSKELEASQLRQETTSLRDSKIELEKDLRDLNGIKLASRERVRMMEASKSDGLQRYGLLMPELIRQIDWACHQRRFHERPRGPLGAHLQLKDGSYALSIEAAIGKGLLTAFCVTDSHDCNQLKLIMKHIYRDTQHPPDVITSTFVKKVYDTSKYRLQSSTCPSVLDMLTIDDPVVANCLIDQRGIESIALIKDGLTARKIMKNNPPPNAKECYTAKGDQVYPSPNFRVYSLAAKNPSFLSHNIDEDIKAEKEKLAGLELQVSSKEKDIEALNHKMITSQQEERSLQKLLAGIVQKSSDKSLELAELRNADEALPVDVATLEEEASSYHQQLCGLNKEHEKMQEQYSLAKVAAEQAQDELVKAHAVLLKVASEGDPKKEELSATEQEVDRARHAWRHYSAKLVEYDKEIETGEQEIRTMTAEVEESRQKALCICPRMKVGKNPSRLEKDIITTSKTIEKQQETEGNLEDVTKHYKESFSKYTEVKSNIRQCKKFVDQLQQIIKDRSMDYRNLISMMSVRARIFFQQLLSNRSYMGRIKFRHSDEQLDIIVSPASSQSSAGPRLDMKGLSGGERSFSTLCFILSLWEGMDSPFRCMDEFDVFMDMVNRHISMQMILHMAETRKSSQFILLTPQNMSQITISDSVRIFQMPDLIRSHQRLSTQEAASNPDDDN